MPQSSTFSVDTKNLNVVINAMGNKTSIAQIAIRPSVLERVSSNRITSAINLGFTAIPPDDGGVAIRIARSGYLRPFGNAQCANCLQ